MSSSSVFFLSLASKSPLWRGYFGSKGGVKWPLSLCSGSTFNKDHITGMMAVVVRLMLCRTDTDIKKD